MLSRTCCVVGAVLLVSSFFIWLAAPSARADKIRKVPVLVNWQGFAEKPPSIDDDPNSEFPKELLDAQKEKLERAIGDANKVLEQCGTHLKNRLRLDNIQHVNRPNGNPKPKSKEKGEDDFDKDTKFAKSELGKKFKKLQGKGKQQKGQKINMVKELPKKGDADTPGRGRIGQPVMWLTPDQLLELPSGKEDPPINAFGGPIIVHELFHNAGLDTHTTDDGNVLNETIHLIKDSMAPNEKVDRGLTAKQCMTLDGYFKKYGVSAPNEKQQTGFVPQEEGLEKKTHYAFFDNPAPDIISPTHVGMLEYSVTDDRRMTGRVSWDDELATVPGTLELSVALAIEQLDVLAEVFVSGEDGELFLEGTTVVSGESIPMIALSANRGGQDEGRNTFVDFEFLLPSLVDDAIDVVTTVSEPARGETQDYVVLLESVGDGPLLNGLPATGVAGDSVAIAGELFDPLEPISLLVEGVVVGSTNGDDTGSFSASFTVPELAAGNYLVEALGESGGFAIGVLSVVPEPSSLPLALAAILALFPTIRSGRRA